MDATYTTTADATGEGRNGTATLEDGSLSLNMAVPTEMGGSGGGANPEQLFALGYAACFHSALKLVAGNAGADVSDSQVSATVGLDNTGSGFELGVELDVSVPKADAGTARDLVDRAHEVCPYSNATRNNIDVTPKVV